MTEPVHDTIPVNDVDQFARYVVQWHQNRMSQLEMALTAPPEVEILIADEQGKQEELALTPEQRKAFRAGLIVAKSLFKDLPFVFTEEPMAALDDPGNDLDLPEACEHAANVQAAAEAPVQPLLDEVIHD